MYAVILVILLLASNLSATDQDLSTSRILTTSSQRVLWFILHRLTSLPLFHLPPKVVSLVLEYLLQRYREQLARAELENLTSTMSLKQDMRRADLGKSIRSISDLLQ